MINLNNNLINAENLNNRTVLGFVVELLGYVLRRRNNKEQKNGEV